MRAERRQQPGVGPAEGQVPGAGRRVGRRARRVATGGRGRTRVPCRPAVASRPRWRSSWYARATVAGLTPSSAARARTGGRAAPAGSAPARTPDSMLAEIAAAVAPVS
ncbi:hypothetical protein JD77_03977 [Micromonospora olivasterospora]|uniref:Uncharacterized protein n=1 Tax=Micromonospora olivasterospora TaxID=1880 RepID=A0A562IE07_MICOL|nr:hypothetical protein JD77_03977 [Micromonospora olivasterospora]